jgi:predicted nucleotidyltransferase
MSYRENIVRIKAVNNALEEISKEVVFVGGATVSLYADRITGEIRPTDDVDILLEVGHYSAYAKIEEKLRKKGFVNDIESGIICRWIIRGIIVDIMPTEGSIPGFTNRWYKEGFTTAMEHRLDNTHAIFIFRPEYFIASKLEAFKNRGENDGRTSTDFEDIIYVLNSRSVIWKEMAESSRPLKARFFINSHPS